MAIRRFQTSSLVALLCFATQGDAQTLADRYREPASRIIARALRDSAAWNRIATLTETFGHRFSGSASLEQAIDWAVKKMKEDGLENVRKEPVMVPKWVRGAESLERRDHERVRLRGAR